MIHARKYICDAFCEGIRIGVDESFAFITGEAMTHDPGNPFDACAVAYEAGQRDALAAAVQRVEALDWAWTYRSGELITRAEAIAAIKGSDE